MVVEIVTPVTGSMDNDVDVGVQLLTSEKNSSDMADTEAPESSNAVLTIQSTSISTSG